MFAVLYSFCRELPSSSGFSRTNATISVHNISAVASMASTYVTKWQKDNKKVNRTSEQGIAHIIY